MCRQPNLHELARKFDARNLRKKLVQVSCASFLTVCHHHNTLSLHVDAVGAADVDERALIEHLFERQNYNPLIRPVQNLSQTLEVGFEMALIQLINLVRKHSTRINCVQRDALNVNITRVGRR